MIQFTKGFAKNTHSPSSGAPNPSYSLPFLHRLSSKIAIRIDYDRLSVRVYEIVSNNEGLFMKPAVTLIGRQGMYLKMYGKNFGEWLFNAPPSVYTDIILMWNTVDLNREIYVNKRDSSKKFKVDLSPH